MSYVAQRVWKDAEAEARIQEIGLDRDLLIRVAAVAIGQASNVTRNFARNAWGTFAYHHGIAELRNQFVGSRWANNISDGIESIVDEAAKRKVTFQNVDEAMGHCDPKPRSPKGAGAERASEGNLPLFPKAPKFAPADTEAYELWALMVDEVGNVELSRPVIQGGTFSICRERIFLAEASEWLGPDPKADDGNDIADDFEVSVVKK